MDTKGTVTGTVEDLKAAGIEVNEENSFTLGQVLRGEHLKPTKQSRKEAKKARRAKARAALEAMDGI